MSSSQVLTYFISEKAKSAEVDFRVPRDLDAGFDIPCLEDVAIEPKSSTLIDTGIHFAIPENWVGFVKDRSSVAMKGGLTAAGVIDASYRGELKILMHNMSEETLRFKKGERVAQMVIIPHLPGTSSLEVAELDKLGETERGAGGFGSTGK